MEKITIGDKGVKMIFVGFILEESGNRDMVLIVGLMEAKTTRHQPTDFRG